MKPFLILSFLFLLIGCVSTIPTNKTNKMDNPFIIKSIKNYLPRDVSIQPAYTIYEGDKWECKYKTDNDDYVCCAENFSTMSPWKYCLLVDKDYNAFAFYELGMNRSHEWSEGKQPIFKK